MCWRATESTTSTHRRWSGHRRPQLRWPRRCNLPIHVLPGLNEIDAGIFEGMPVNVGDLPLGGALYLLAPVLLDARLGLRAAAGLHGRPERDRLRRKLQRRRAIDLRRQRRDRRRHRHRRGVLPRSRDRDLDTDERQQPRFRGRTPGVPQHRRIAALHGPSRGRRLPRGLDAGQLGRDSRCRRIRDWRPSCSSTSAT